MRNFCSAARGPSETRRAAFQNEVQVTRAWSATCSFTDTGEPARLLCDFSWPWRDLSLRPSGSETYLDRLRWSGFNRVTFTALSARMTLTAGGPGTDLRAGRIRGITSRSSSLEPPPHDGAGQEQWTTLTVPGGPERHGRGGRRTLGFKMPAGSSAHLSRRNAASSASLRLKWSQGRFAVPMPCSELMLPPSSAT